MMGRQNNDQGPLFYEFCLDEAVPADHLVRKIDAILDLSWVYAELAPHYPALGRPSVDPVLMIRMLIMGYVFALRSERLLCRELQVNLAYRWFCKLGIELVRQNGPWLTLHQRQKSSCVGAVHT
jgi:transposase